MRRHSRRSLLEGGEPGGEVERCTGEGQPAAEGRGWRVRAAASCGKGIGKEVGAPESMNAGKDNGY